MDECAEEWGADFIVTAHTASDQMESFFVDLMTGVSVFTLGGISVQNGRYIRPMLEISTEMVNDYLAKKGLEPVYDSSNSDLRYVRNFVREKLMPLLEDNTQLRASISRIQEESCILNAYFTKLTEDFAYCPPEGGVVIDREHLNTAEPMLQHYILGKWISQLARGGTVHINAVLKQMQQKRSARIDLPQSFYCEITPRRVRIFHKSLVAAFQMRADLYDGNAELPKHLRTSNVILRSRKNGDRYKDKKIKDLFERLKLDLYDRDRAIIAEMDKQIVWVEYVNS